MEDTDSRQLAYLHWLSSDLAAVLGLTALTWAAVFIPPLHETSVRTVLGLLFTLFVPGYAFVAALFPYRSAEPESIDEPTNQADTAGLSDRDLDTLERSVFSFGMSIVLVSILMIALHFSPWRIDSLSVLAGLTAITASAAGVAVMRRAGRNGSRVGFNRKRPENARSKFFGWDGYANRLITGVLLIGLLVGAGGIAYLVTVHETGSFTEFYVLMENGSSNFVATEYSAETLRDDSSSLTLHISNHGNERISYTVIAAVQRVRIVNGSVRVLNQREIERFRPSVQSGENWSTSLKTPPSMSGDSLRLVYLLYRDQPPRHPTVDNAYLELHLWINGSNMQETASAKQATSKEGS